jgi:hypothetical protein
LNNLCKVKVIFFVSPLFSFLKRWWSIKIINYRLFCFFALTSTFLPPIVGEKDFLPNLYVTRY